MTHIGDRQYLVRTDEFGSAEIVAGPFALYDDEHFELELIQLLQEHPWDDEKSYSCLMIAAAGQPEIEELNDEYLASVIEEAWGPEIEEQEFI